MIDTIRKHLRRKTDPIELLHRLAPVDAQLETIVHVGAHLAQERSHYESHGYKQIMWIEASEEIHGRLAEVINNHQGTAEHLTQCALLTDQDDEPVELRHFSNDGMSSSIFSQTQQSVKRWPGVVETGSTEAAISKTLDTLLSETKFIDHCDVLIVDVQGAELLVLKGAEVTLKSAKAVICEVSTQPFYEGGVMFKELAQFLSTYDFVPMAAPPRHGDMLFMRRHASARVVA